MAKSIRQRLDDLKRQEVLAKERLDKIAKDKDRLIGPTRARTLTMMTRVTNAFFEEHLEAMLGKKVDLSPIERDLQALLERTLLAAPSAPAQEPSGEAAPDIVIDEI